MIEFLPEDYEIIIYGCNKGSHRFHIVLMKNDNELTNIKCNSLEYGMGLMEEYLSNKLK